MSVSVLVRARVIVIVRVIDIGVVLVDCLC